MKTYRGIKPGVNPAHQFNGRVLKWDGVVRVVLAQRMNSEAWDAFSRKAWSEREAKEFADGLLGLYSRIKIVRFK